MQRNIYIIDRLANCLIGIIAKKGHCSDHTSSKSVAIIYLHKETSFVFDTSSVLIPIEYDRLSDRSFKMK